ncbi:uncharacterized protein LOC110846369 [Folsomia candida]|uniref:uncharacterized protein LOC110846369 n=1 Tax=Folsomia candida TaxID=158441 RepID=UPI000B8F9611|nr:uncharacterized protein LOC110846369 [Folsomia candida]
MISDSELLRQEPKVGVDLFFWKDDNDDIQMRVMTEQDIKKKLTQIYFSLLTDKHGDMRDMTVNKGPASTCLIVKTESVVGNFNSNALDLDGCKVKELEEQWGWKVDPKLTYSFHIYTDDSWVADQLRFRIRRKFGVVCAKAPYSSEVVLAKYAEKIDAHLRQFLHRLPQIREDYFNNPPPPPPEKLQNPRPLPPSQERRKCVLCGEVIQGIASGHLQHMISSHYSDAFPCNLCPCSFATPASRHSHRAMYHPGTEPPKRNTFGIPDINEEDAAKCDALMELLPLEEGSKAIKYRCIWGRDSGRECGKMHTGLLVSREHACSHLGLKPHTCPASGCYYSSSFYSTTVKHYKNEHQGEEVEDKDSEEQDDEPPDKKTKSSAQPRQSSTRKSC